MRALGLVLEVFVKLLIAIAFGCGVATATFASLLLGTEKMTSFDQLAQEGPPPVEATLSAGAGLIALAAVLLLFSIGPLGRKRWFVSYQQAEQPRQVERPAPWDEPEESAPYGSEP